MYCIKCGHKVEENWNNCPSCSTPINRTGALNFQQESQLGNSNVNKDNNLTTFWAVGSFLLILPGFYLHHFLFLAGIVTITIGKMVHPDSRIIGIAFKIIVSMILVYTVAMVIMWISCMNALSNCG
jgi:hypothetical protein